MCFLHFSRWKRWDDEDDDADDEDGEDGDGHGRACPNLDIGVSIDACI